MANPDNPNGFKPVRTDSGQMAVVWYPVAASQTIAQGDAVILASGLIEIAVLTSPQLLGVAASDVTTTGSVTRANKVAVYVATPGQVFEGQCSGSSTAAILGTSCDIEGATGVMEINENATTEDVIHIVGWRSDEDPKLALGLNDIGKFVIIRSQYYPALAAK
tara:strand:+ start:70 stop:558 length:489 start_codon:yes stop_codon:yes gene_type:complete